MDIPKSMLRRNINRTIKINTGIKKSIKTDIRIIRTKRNIGTKRSKAQVERRTNITAAVVAVRIRKKKETRRGSIKMKGKIRTESTKVVHPAKTRSTRALVLGNLTGLA